MPAGRGAGPARAPAGGGSGGANGGASRPRWAAGRRCRAAGMPPACGGTGAAARGAAGTGPAGACARGACRLFGALPSLGSTRAAQACPEGLPPCAQARFLTKTYSGSSPPMAWVVDDAWPACVLSCHPDHDRPIHGLDNPPAARVRRRGGCECELLHNLIDSRARQDSFLPVCPARPPSFWQFSGIFFPRAQLCHPLYGLPCGTMAAPAGLRTASSDRRFHSRSMPKYYGLGAGT